MGDMRSDAAYLREMGIELWCRRSVQADPGSSTEVVEEDPAAPLQRPLTADWPALEAMVAGCRRCPLHAGRTHTVFGTGSCSAEWLFVGEAPGAEEDRQGLPFVGAAGRLLNAMLHAVGMGRNEVYIANVLKCRPPKNRDPQGQEVSACEPFLHRQVQLLAPRIIVALGRFAAQSLLKTDEPIGRMRGRVFRYGEAEIPLVVTYHPAYLLRNPLDKRKAWADLCLARVAASDP